MPNKFEAWELGHEEQRSILSILYPHKLDNSNPILEKLSNGVRLFKPSFEPKVLLDNLCAKVTKVEDPKCEGFKRFHYIGDLIGSMETNGGLNSMRGK
jgi:hypothetical protein